MSNPRDAEVDAVIEQLGGDVREAIRALLHELAALEAAVAVTVSHGFVRGRGIPAAPAQLTKE